jgi:RHS repeat-associated protein
MYDPYGRVTVYEPDWSDTVAWEDSVKNEVLFAGYRFDAETGLYHVRNRQYHPTLGRWIERDPAGYLDGPNLYAYVSGNPAVSVDPTGLCGETAPMPGQVVPLAFWEPPGGPGRIPPSWWHPEIDPGAWADSAIGGILELLPWWLRQPLAGIGPFIRGGHSIPGAIWGAWKSGGRIPGTSLEGDIRFEAFHFGWAISGLWPPDKASSPPYRPEWVANAARHAYWQAVLTQLYGESIAEQLGLIHEAGADDDWDSFADLYNNIIGRSIGSNAKSFDEILAMILDALEDGTLIVAPWDPRIPPEIRPPIRQQPPGGPQPLPLAPPNPGPPQPIPTAPVGQKPVLVPL